MRIGILVMFINNFGQRGLYNSQEIGMAKELHSRGYTVEIYKCVERSAIMAAEDQYSNIEYHLFPVTKIGNNVVSDFKWLNREIDALICFSDVQLFVSKVYHWSRRNGIIFIPYVGITESTSSSPIIRLIIAINARKIFAIYKENGVFAKTNAVKDKLRQKGVTNVKVAPVGLDFSVMNANYAQSNNMSIRKKYGIGTHERLVLLIGRLQEDRNPLDCIPVFERIHSIDPNFRLLVIGKGSLRNELFRRLKEKGLDSNVRYIAQVKNSDMWELYRISECLVSFSRTEIFGMSILEAMYYETPVFAIHAPGPNDIIENGISGYLYDSPEQMAKGISMKNSAFIKEEGHKRVIEIFSWVKACDMFEQFIREINSTGACELV